jgi:hypothetical protein
MHDSKSTPWRPEVFARKWRALAERRRSHLKELYDSGAFKRHVTEDILRAHMREAVREAESWGAMADETAPAAPEAREAPDTNTRAA